MNTYGLVEPFGTDDGSLENVSPQEAFALGVEWAMFRERLKTGEPFHILCLENNAIRLEKMAERNGRFSESRRTSAHGWAEVWIGSPITGFESSEQEST